MHLIDDQEKLGHFQCHNKDSKHFFFFFFCCLKTKCDTLTDVQILYLCSAFLKSGKICSYQHDIGLFLEKK